MSVNSETVADARRGKRDAVVEVLTFHYPIVWRMATGLTGRADVGRGVVKYIMHRSLRALDSWREEGSPTRWFQHHTVLATRRTLKHSPDVATDTLLSGSTDPGYVAFIRALRNLPMQQREAFILTHGEKFDLRAVAVAMDCSTTAAANHLREATDRLRALAPTEIDQHIGHLQTVYQKLGPDEQLSVGAIRQDVRRFMLPWLVARAFKIICAVLLLIATTWLGLWVWRIVRNSMEHTM